MKTCCECKKNESEVEFTVSRKYHCKNCIRKRNQEYTLKQGKKLKFIPIITDTHKQCGECKEMVELSKFSPSIRGKLGLSSYCKYCSSKRQLKRVSKEDRKIQTQKYRDNNREWWRALHRINQFNRRNKIKLASDGTITQYFVKEIYSIENCYYCKDFTPEKFRTLEHKQPLNKGGLHSSNNIVMSCLQCNCTKRDMTEEEFKNYKNKIYE
jgi:hypothetical protein